MATGAAHDDSPVYHYLYLSLQLSHLYTSLQSFMDAGEQSSLANRWAAVRNALYNEFCKKLAADISEVIRDRAAEEKISCLCWHLAAVSSNASLSRHSRRDCFYDFCLASSHECCTTHGKMYRFG